EYVAGDNMTVAVTARTAGKVTLNVIGDRLVSPVTQDVTAGTAGARGPARRGPTRRAPRRRGGAPPPPGEHPRIVVAAVDVGILNLTNYKPPAPDDYYLGQRRLTAEIRDLSAQMTERIQGARA